MAHEAATSPEAAPVDAAPVAVVSAVSEEIAKGLRLEAAGLYVKMQRDWLHFARKVTEINDANAFVALGHDTFKAFCVAEYPTLNYAQMTKMVQVVKEFGPTLEARVLAAPEEPVPALDTLYTLVTAKRQFHDDKAASRKIGGWTAKLMSNEMGFSKLKEAIKSLRESKVPAPTPETAAAAQALEDGLVKDLENSGELKEMSDADRTTVAIMSQLPPFTESLKLLQATLTDHPEQVSDRVDQAFTALNEMLILLDKTLEFYDKFRKEHPATA